MTVCRLSIIILCLLTVYVLHYLIVKPDQQLQGDIPPEISRKVMGRKDKREKLSGDIPLEILKKVMGRKDKSEKLVTLFTSFIDSQKKRNIHRNVILNWANISTRIQPIFFGNLTKNSELCLLARKLGWILHPTERLYNGDGPPFLKDMYRSATRLSNSLYYGFANGDLLFTEDLITNLEAVSRVLNNVTMIVGQRSNMAVNESSEVPFYKSVDIKQKALSKYSPWAEDYFFLQHPQSFPWHMMKDVIIGTKAYDNYFPAVGVLGNVSVVDASNTLLAAHQTGTDGDHAAHRHKYSYVNFILIPGTFDYNKGTTANVPYLTVMGSAGNISIQRRTKSVR